MALTATQWLEKFTGLTDAAEQAVWIESAAGEYDFTVLGGTRIDLGIGLMAAHLYTRLAASAAGGAPAAAAGPIASMANGSTSVSFGSAGSGTAAKTDAEADLMTTKFGAQLAGMFKRCGGLGLAWS